MTFDDAFPPFLTIQKHTTLSSTNTYIKERLAQFRKNLPLMVTADEQTRGRGRETRHWLSSKGLGLYASIALAVEKREHLPFLALTSGLAVIATLRQLGIHEQYLRLKWPNDVLCETKKIAGVLFENIIQADEITSICGIGINLNHLLHDFPVELADRATSLKMVLNEQIEPERAASPLANHFFYWLKKLQQGESKLIVDKCNEYSKFMLNKEIAIQMRTHTIHGLFSGINEDGGLLLKDLNGSLHCHFSGEIQDISANPDQRF